MTKTITVGLITHKEGAHVHAYLNALRDSVNCDRVILVDPDHAWDEPAQRILTKKLQGRYDSLDRMLQKENPTMALVTMEAAQAPPIIDQSLEAGCHVFSEKPACVSLHQFTPLVEKADRKHLHLMFAFANRIAPEVKAARKLITEGHLGRIYGLEMHLIADQTRLTRIAYQKQWFADRARSGGGHLIWLGIHWLDLCMHLTGSRITHVTGAIANVGGQAIGVEDSAVATLEFDNGTLGTLTSGYFLDKGYHSQIKIWGSQGWLQLQPGQTPALKWNTTKEPSGDSVQQFTEAIQPRGYTPFVQQAVASCAGHGSVPISNEESLTALQTVFAIYRSADTGRRMPRNSEMSI